MEGSEEVALDLVMGYRGLLGGSMVGLFSHLISTDRTLPTSAWWRAGFRANWSILFLTPLFMMTVRRLTSYTGKKSPDTED